MFVRGQRRAPVQAPESRVRVATIGIIVGAVGTAVGLFTLPSIFYVPGGIGLAALVLGIIGWAARPRAWFALIFAALALCEALYGFGQYNHVRTDHSALPAPHVAASSHR